MSEDLLPLGTVFKSKNSCDLFMIYGYYALDKINNNKYKYVCCPYPYGIDNINCYAFDDEKIDKIIFYGYQTNKLTEFRKKFVEANKMLSNNEDLIKINELFNVKETDEMIGGGDKNE